MAQGLHLSQRLTQSLVLAPQLQQSLALLQAPTLELKALVEQELQQNPVLEEAPAAETDLQDKENRGVGAARRAADPSEPPADLDFDPATEKSAGEPVDDFQAEFDRLVQLDQEWRDHFAQTNLPMRASAEDEEKRQFMFDSLVADTSLQEMLLEQVRESALPEDQRPIAEMLIGNIDEYGYLKATIEELAASTGLPADRSWTCSKSFRPLSRRALARGTCANACSCNSNARASSTRSNTASSTSSWRRWASGASRRSPAAPSDPVDAVQEALQRIARLEPRPGRAFLPDNDQYVLPEVFVRKSGDDYVVTTNNEHIPHLRISNTYKDLMSQRENSSEVRNYIREKIRAGKFLIKSLYQRQETILNIANEIVRRQRDFMAKGVAALKPLTMVQVAQVVGVHETTVSRAVSGKYMQTPQGMFEMKYFFTAGIQTASGQGMSNTSVKDMIADIFKAEDTGKPLSDQEVVKHAQRKGHRHRPPHGGEVSHRAEHPPVELAEGVLTPPSVFRSGWSADILVGFA